MCSGKREPLAVAVSPRQLHHPLAIAVSPRQLHHPLAIAVFPRQLDHYGPHNATHLTDVAAIQNWVA